MKTYTRALEDLDAGKLPQWSTQPVRNKGSDSTRILATPTSIQSQAPGPNEHEGVAAWSMLNPPSASGRVVGVARHSCQRCSCSQCYLKLAVV